MRVLLAHNVYRHEGGEERAVRQLQAALEERGHSVQIFERQSRDWHNLSLLEKVVAAVQIPYSFSTRNDLEPHLKAFAPDVIHVHNLFPFISPSIYDIARLNNIPVIQTLHNYRLFCMNGLLFREGKPCELCVKGPTVHGFIHACYQGSRLNSAVMAATLGAHRTAETWAKKVGRFIVLSDFSLKMYERAGFPTEKMKVLPNFSEQGPKPTLVHGTSFLFMGRLSVEKGLLTLLEAFRLFSQENTSATLNIAGEGPLMGAVQEFQRKNPTLSVRVHGFVSGLEKERLLNEARYVVFPSECYENCPYGLLEPLGRGIPVLGADRGAIPEIIHDGKTGWLFAAGSADSLAAAMAAAANLSPEKETAMRRAAWEDSWARFSMETWVKEIENLYHSVSS